MSYKYPQDLFVTEFLRKLGGETTINLPELKPDELGRQLAFLDGIPGLCYEHHGWCISLALRKEEESLNFMKKEDPPR